MAKTVVIFNTVKTFNKYSLEQIGIVDWSEVLGNCLWVSYMSRYENDSYMNVQAYPIWAEIKENVEKENWSEVYKLGKKFTSKVVKAKDLEMHAECAIKSMMSMMNYDNLSAIVSSEKPKVIMQTIADAINERTDDSSFAWDLKWKLTSSDKKDTIVMDFSNYKFKLIPCNDAYQYYNMEDYYDKLDFKMYDNKQLYECKSNKKSLKERKKFQYGDEVINFLENYGYYKRGEDFEQHKDYSTVTYMYAISQGMRPQTPYVEFTVDADNDAFIFGEYFTDGRKGYSTEFDSVEDLEYFVSNANYKNSDLTESKNIPTIEGNYKANDGNDYYNIALNLENGDFVRIKNASCTAVAEEMACEYFNVPYNAMTYKTIKIIFMGTSPNLDLNKIPKKYQKYFNKINESKKSLKESTIEKDIEDYVYDKVSSLYDSIVEVTYNDNDELVIKIGVWDLYGTNKADKISSMLSRDNHFMKMVDNTDRICKLSIYDVEKPSVYRVDQI